MLSFFQAQTRAKNSYVLNLSRIVSKLLFFIFSQCSMRHQLFFCVAHEGTCQQLSIQKEQITEKDSSYMNIYSFPLM